MSGFRRTHRRGAPKFFPRTCSVRTSARRQERVMSSGVRQPVGQGEAIREERFRILVAVRDHLDEVIEAAVAAMQEEIPVYAECEPGWVADVRHQVGRHYRMKLECLLDGHDVTLESLSFTRGAAMRRARAGLRVGGYNKPLPPRPPAISGGGG